MLIKKFPVNVSGRDFVCGDLHGSYSRVEQFLTSIGFDKTRDRFFCTGDIVDRGPESLKCIGLLYEPWFFSVMGNHDFMANEVINGPGNWKYVFFGNGGGWVREHLGSKSDIDFYIRGAYENIISKLPVIITVDKKSGGKFHIVHAEINAPVELNDDILADEDYVKQLMSIKNGDGEFIMWGRHIFGQCIDRHLDEIAIRKIKTHAGMHKLGTIFGPNLSHIYSGHSIVRKPIQMYGQTDLDTMAFGSYRELANSFGFKSFPSWAGLTVTEPETGKFWLVNEDGVNETDKLIIT